MKLIRQTPQELVLQHRPLALGLALSGMTLMLLALTLWNLVLGAWVKAGAGFACTLGVAVPALGFSKTRVDIRFDRATALCDIKKKKLTGETFEQFSLADISCAKVESVKTPIQSDGAHRVALVLDSGTDTQQIPLAPGYTSKSNATDLAARINTWLTQADSSS